MCAHAARVANETVTCLDVGGLARRASSCLWVAPLCRSVFVAMSGVLGRLCQGEHPFSVAVILPETFELPGWMHILQRRYVCEGWRSGGVATQVWLTWACAVGCVVVRPQDGSVGEGVAPGQIMRGCTTGCCSTGAAAECWRRRSLGVFRTGHGGDTTSRHRVQAGGHGRLRNDALTPAQTAPTMFYESE